MQHIMSPAVLKGSNTGQPRTHRTAMLSVLKHICAPQEGHCGQPTKMHLHDQTATAPCMVLQATDYMTANALLHGCSLSITTLLYNVCYAFATNSTHACVQICNTNANSQGRCGSW